MKLRRFLLVACVFAVGCSTDMSPSPSSPTKKAETETQTQVVTAVQSLAAHASGPYLVIENVRFVGIGGGTGCDVVLADVSNQGDAEQPFGWSWTVQIPNLQIKDTFFGGQPLLPGETRVLAHNPGVTAPGTHRVKVSAQSSDGRTKSAAATLRIPC